MISDTDPFAPVVFERPRFSGLLREAALCALILAAALVGSVAVSSHAERPCCSAATVRGGH